MNRLFALLILFAPSTRLFSQSQTQDFELTLPKIKVPFSLYRTIGFLDSRTDTTNMGIVQPLLSNQQATVISKTPLSVQLTNFLNAITDSTAGNGELLFQLKQLNFTEALITGINTGHCTFYGLLYKRVGDKYQKIRSVDTVIFIVTKDIAKWTLRWGSQLITSLIANNLTARPTDPANYTRDELADVDNIEKQKIRLYNTKTYTDGLYLTYRSFSDQIPDDSITVETRHGHISTVTTIDSNYIPNKVHPKKVYAIVYHGAPYIATDYNFYPLEKRKDDFVFVGRQKIRPNGIDIWIGYVEFGLLGAFSAFKANAVFETKIDYTNGGLIKLREAALYEDTHSVF